MIVTPVVAVAIALAAYRVARGITSDSLFEGWRGKLEDWAYGGTDKLWYRDVTLGQKKYTLASGTETMAPRRSRILTLARGKFADLMTCPLCLGFHASWIALCVWTALWPWQLGWKGWTLAFAIAGLQFFLTTVDGEFRSRVKIEE